MSYRVRARASWLVVLAVLSSLLVVLQAGPARAETFTPGTARFAGVSDWGLTANYPWVVSFTVEPRVLSGYTADSLWIFKGYGGGNIDTRPYKVIAFDLQCPDGSWRAVGAAPSRRRCTSRGGGRRAEDRESDESLWRRH